MSDTTYTRKGPGRPKRGNTVQKSTVMLPPFLHDWAMQQPEGLSGLVRRLLLQAYETQRTRALPSRKALGS